MRAEEKVERLEGRAPGAVELAVLTSSMVSIDASVARAVRLALCPHRGADAEADLWSSDLVDARAGSTITIVPGVAAVLRRRLRDRLAADEGLKVALDAIRSAPERAVPGALQLEEHLRWIETTADPSAQADLAEPLLAGAVAALLDPSRAGLGAWGARALRRLPSFAFGARSGRQLAQVLVASGALPASALAAVPVATEALDLADAAELSRVLGASTVLGVRRAGDLLQLGDVGEDGSSIRLPATEPRVVEVNDDLARVPAGSTVDVAVGWGECWLRTGSGDVYLVSLEPPATADVLGASTVVVHEWDRARTGVVVRPGLVVTTAGPLVEPSDVASSEPVRDPMSIEWRGRRYRVDVRARRGALVLLDATDLPAPAAPLGGSPLRPGVWHGRAIGAEAPWTGLPAEEEDRLVPVAGRVTPAGLELRSGVGALQSSGCPVVRSGLVAGVLVGQDDAGRLMVDGWEEILRLVEGVVRPEATEVSGLDWSDATLPVVLEPSRPRLLAGLREGLRAPDINGAFEVEVYPLGSSSDAGSARAVVAEATPDSSLLAWAGGSVAGAEGTEAIARVVRVPLLDVLVRFDGEAEHDDTSYDLSAYPPLREVLSKGRAGTPVVRAVEAAGLEPDLLLRVAAPREVRPLVRVLRADGVPLGADVEAAGPSVTEREIAAVAARVEHIATWERQRALGRHFSDLRGTVRLHVTETLPPEGGSPVGQERSTSPRGGRHRFEYRWVGSEWQNPELSMRVMNGSERALFACILVYSDRYRCHDSILPATRLATGESLLVWDGRPVPLTLPAGHPVEPGAEGTDWLQLLVSTDPFESSAFTLPSIDEPQVGTRGASPRSPLDRIAARVTRDLEYETSSTDTSDWFAELHTIVTVVPDDRLSQAR